MRHPLVSRLALLAFSAGAAWPVHGAAPAGKGEKAPAAKAGEKAPAAGGKAGEKAPAAATADKGAEKKPEKKK